MKRSIVVLLIVMLSFSASAQRKKSQSKEDSIVGLNRIVEVMSLIDNQYVDAPNMNEISEQAVKAMLKDLDPHSVYIAAKDVQRANEGLQGNFEGVGVSFQIIDDTIRVVDVIVGGPSEKVGLMRGDKFLKIDGKPATGDSINNAWVPKYLRGKGGSKVELEMLRGDEILNFTVVRGKVPIYSVDSYFMADDSIGYIRLTRFARTSIAEVRVAMRELKRQGMKRLMLDLRGNTGGYLDIACGLANEFLPSNSLIVYTEGRTSVRRNHKTNRFGHFRKGELVVMIDEGSASASEIVSGAVQDWDRGLLVGRRSYGKGLVQRLFELKDGAQVRLTTARYYTPSGRCIQRPYVDGADAYRNDINERYKHGEFVNVDSIHFADSLKYKTSKGRTVYGGGGIMPDVFVPMDTNRLSDYFVQVRSKGLLNEWATHWADEHREEYSKMGFENFIAQSEALGLEEAFESYAASKDVVKDTALEATMKERVAKTDNYMKLVLKALVAKDVYGFKYYYLVMKEADDCYNVALNTIRNMKEN